MSAGGEPLPALELWRATQAGAPEARDQLLGLCYAELRALARRMLAGDSAAAHLRPTELANEVALRVLKLERMDWKDRAHFLATASTIMRQALLDEMRRVRAGKRQARSVVTTIVEAGVSTLELDLELLDAALRRLALVSEERARLVELRFFAGLTIEETATVLGISPASVKRQWEAARVWLLRDINRAAPRGPAAD
ncbi:MAG: ECF-type sigma factor [Steroidobacteraceae bacterium]